MLLTACATEATRHCPLSQMTEISAEGDHPQNLAMTTAAQATLTAGYDEFAVLRSEDTGHSFDILIRMSNADDPVSVQRYVARDVLERYN